MYVVHALEATVLLKSSWNVYHNVWHDDISVKFEYGSCQIKFNENFVHPLQATVLLQSSWNFTKMFVWKISRWSSNMCHVKSKSRSLRQFSLKPCSLSRGHSFISIFMKLHQNVCRTKSRSLGQICSKPCSSFRGHSFASIVINFYQNVSLHDTSPSYLGQVRTLDQKLGH